MKGIRGRGAGLPDVLARLFDRAWYLSQNDDVALAGAEPLHHYVNYGWREGRKPHPLFDPQWYAAHHADVAAADVDPFRHYLTTGWREGRRPHPLFDPAWYHERHGACGGPGSLPARTLRHCRMEKRFLAEPSV